MSLTKQQIKQLNTIFNVATLLGAEYAENKSIIGITLLPIILDTNGKIPADPRISVIFLNVSRVIASLRRGAWNDQEAEIKKFNISDLLKVVQSFGGGAIYGSNFIDNNKDNFNWWSKNPSFDLINENMKESKHTMDLFQEEGRNRHLDVKIWFDDLKIFNANKREVAIEDLFEAGKRAWDGISRGDEEAGKFGIMPLDKFDSKNFEDRF